ncbi:ribosome silencing factor [Fournierella massiliensis]|nr:ribosome silencing factor [Fournierella massiliensis]MCF2556164.1 ribosome silencing factor [Fournierella massiliensis]
MESKELAIRIAKILDKKKAEGLKVLSIRDLTVLADYFVIASGTSSTHVRSLADEVEFQLGQQGVEPQRVEGYEARNWILMDYGGVIVHIFYPEARSYYDLEHLWADAQPVDLSGLLEEEAAEE